MAPAECDYICLIRFVCSSKNLVDFFFFSEISEILIWYSIYTSPQVEEECKTDCGRMVVGADGTLNEKETIDMGTSKL